MKIKKFRIWNYRSIKDSGDCYLSESVTILAGKNESGKSSILQALADFNVGAKISDKAKPIEQSSLLPKISILFEVQASDVKSILTDELKIDASGVGDSPFEIEVTKVFPDIYSSDLASLYKARLLEKFDHRAAILETHLKLQQNLETADPEKKTQLPTINMERLRDSANAVDKFVSSCESLLAEKPEQVRTQVSLLAKKLAQQLRDFESDLAPDRAAFITELKEYLPNFILFSSFDDVFPSEIPLGELKTNAWISDLSEMSDIDVSTIVGTNDRAKITHKKKLNVSLNSDFRKFWSQDVSEIVVEWDNQKLNFWIEENGLYYEPEIRSPGRRWHLAFYIRVSARARENVRNVILIDEPGLYLHANAQQDILRNLEEAGHETQVVFSTHSPYLIEPERLERLRLVQKTPDLGTAIENKIHKVSDKETLTPVLTAIGLHLNRGIVGVDKNKNVIVEGISDYYFLNGLRIILDLKEMNFISGGGASNMPFVGTILQGWGSKVVYLYDNEKSYKDAVKNIKANWLLLTTEILVKLPVDGAIEDMFSKEDFAKLVLEIESKEIKGKNSEYMKGKDKVLVSKLWLEKVKRNESDRISAATRENAKKLMSALIAAFEKA
jgi:hypothetical protein